MSLAGAGAAAVLLVLSWVLALHVGFFERADQSIFNGFYGFNARPHLSRVANFIAGLCDPSPYIFLAAVPVLVAIVRRRFRVLLAIGVILLGANVTTHVLKPLLAETRIDYGAGYRQAFTGTWPSGHATAAMSLALCCVLAASPRLRPAVAALGGAFAVAVSYSFLVLGWHYPSDVFGGFLVAGVWTLLAVSMIFLADARWPRAPAPERDRVRLSVRDALAPQVAVLVGALAVVAAVVVTRPHAVLSYVQGHETFMFGAAAIGVLALGLAGVIAVTVRR
jgi:membrane-associated phospholipid phosphatase